MSAGDGVSRRALISGGAASIVYASAAAKSVHGVSVVNSPAGEFHGDRIGAVDQFLGVRYGAPVAMRRFQAPAPAEDAHEPIMCREFAAACPQRAAAHLRQDEDCLFLNIWRPAARRERDRRPVMAYFHGGAYSTGSVADALNKGDLLAARGDIVVVTVNHRLNAFGYLYLARLDARFPDAGNVGQLDLVLALQWIQRNIAAFGGDPDNVTVFGQSGGGAKIATLMAMPAAKGLFHKAITMSGQQVTVSGPQHATARAEAFISALGGADPAQAPTASIVAALEVKDPFLDGPLYFGPTLDMRSLTRHPFYPDAHPQSHRIPMMLGNAVAESRAFFPADHPKISGLDWKNIAQRIAGEMRIDIHPEWVVDRMRARYPHDDPRRLFHRIVTGSRSWRGQIIEAEMRAVAGCPAHVYQLDFEDAKHTDDIGLVFGTIAPSTRRRAAMSARMMEAFIRFARTGDPGWAPYDLATRKTMIFDVESRVVEDPRRFERTLFERVPYIQPGT